MGQGHVSFQLGQTVPKMFDIVVGAGGFIVRGGKLIEDLASIPKAAQTGPDPSPACRVRGSCRHCHGYLMTARGTAR